MSSTSISQSATRFTPRSAVEAPGSSVRSAGDFQISKRQQAKARRTARQIDGSRAVNPRTVAPILAALSAFGGRITSLELPAQ